MAVAPESYVLDSKGNCSASFSGRGVGVLTDSEEIVEGNVDEVCPRFFPTCGLVSTSLLQKVLRQSYWHCQLGLGWGIFSAVGFYLPLEAGVIDSGAIGGAAVDGVVPVSQFEGLANGAKRVLYRSNADLMASSCTSLSYILGKTGKEIDLVCSGLSREKRVHTNVCCPLFPSAPISQLDLGSLVHDPMGSGLLRSNEKTRVVSLELGRHSFQDLPCGRGKRELN